MTSLLAVALLLLGFTSTVAAFGGETWLKTDAPLLKRITTRGWVSAIALVLALVVGIAKEVRAHGATEEAKKENGELRKQLSASQAALEELRKVAERTNKLTTLSTLLKSQPTMEVAIAAMVNPIRDPKEPVPTHVVDFLFPAWKRLGVSDPEQLLLAIEVKSRDDRLLGNLWGFRKDPYAIRTLGYAKAEQQDGTETSLEMNGGVEIRTVGKETEIVSSFRFPTPQLPGKWLSHFPQGTPVIKFTLFIKKGISAVDRANLVAFYQKLFRKEGQMTIPVLDVDGLQIAYELTRGDVRLGDSVMKGADMLTVSYSISSKPSVELPDF